MRMDREHLSVLLLNRERNHYQRQAAATIAAKMYRVDCFVMWIAGTSMRSGKDSVP